MLSRTEASGSGVSASHLILNHRFTNLAHIQNSSQFRFLFDKANRFLFVLCNEG